MMTGASANCTGVLGAGNLEGDDDESSFPWWVWVLVIAVPLLCGACIGFICYRRYVNDQRKDEMLLDGLPAYGNEMDVVPYHESRAEPQAFQRDSSFLTMSSGDKVEGGQAEHVPNVRSRQYSSARHTSGDSQSSEGGAGETAFNPGAGVPSITRPASAQPASVLARGDSGGMQPPKRADSGGLNAGTSRLQRVGAEKYTIMV